jgi:hypothetical protein
VGSTIVNEPRHTKLPIVEVWCAQAWPLALSALLVNIPRPFFNGCAGVVQASKNITSAQKLEQHKLMEADVSDPSSSKDESSREKPRRTPKAASNSKGAAAAVASGRQPSAKAPKVAGCLEKKRGGCPY